MNKRQLNLFDLTMIVVSLVIGMGIFRTPVSAAARAGTPSIFFLAWLAGGLIALCGALTYAEIGSRYPVTGGYYKVFSYGYHPSIAFAVNCIILLSNAGSTAVVGLIGAEYIGRFFYPDGAPETFRQVVTIGGVIFFYVINLLGLKMSSRVLNALTVIKLLLILLLLLSVFGHYPLPAHTAPAAGASLPQLSFFKALGFALVAASFSYGGYQQTINFGGEVSNPSRTLPRGIGYGITIIILLYLSLNLVYTKVIGFEQLKTSDSIAALLMQHLFGPVGDTVLRVLMFLSVMCYVNVSLMSNPRVMYAMSNEGILPAAFGKRSERRDVIVWSLTVFAAIIIATLFFSSAVDRVINYSIFLDSFGFAFSAGTIFILRRRKMGEDKNIYRMKLFPVMPLIFIIAYACIAVSIAIGDPASAGYGLLIFACCFGLYFIIRRRRRPSGEGVSN